MQIIDIIYFIEALLQIQAPQANHFTFQSWLLYQGLLPNSAAEAKGMGLADKAATWSKLQGEVTMLMANVLVNLAAAGGDEDAQQKAVEPLLSALEDYLPRLFVPNDWKIVWMGVET